MKTWAHGLEIYDLLGIDRQSTNRIRNIAHLGVSTFGWRFANREKPAPSRIPYVEFLAPSGQVWTWGQPSEVERIDGATHQFCQTRKIADTNLQMTRPIAKEWMKKAQCFAGPSRDPPSTGSRYLNPNAKVLMQLTHQ